MSVSLDVETWKSVTEKPLSSAPQENEGDEELLPELPRLEAVPVMHFPWYPSQRMQVYKARSSPTQRLLRRPPPKLSLQVKPEKSMPP